MEEYEVRDVANRSEAPELRISFWLDSSQYHLTDGRMLARCELQAIIANDSPVPAEYAVIYLYFDHRLDVIDTPKGFRRHRGTTLEPTGLNRRILVLQKNWSVPGNLPIFQHQDFQIATPPVTVEAPAAWENVPTDYLLGWEVRAPRMGVRRAFKSLRVATGSTSSIAERQEALDQVVVAENYSAPGDSSAGSDAGHPGTDTS
jgi:hypothetical protein